MTTNKLSKGIGGVPGPLNTTGPKATKIDRLIGYLMRKRKSSTKTVSNIKQVEYTLPSSIGIQNLQTSVKTKNRYDVLNMDMADKEMLVIEETHYDCDGITMIGGTPKMLAKAEFGTNPIYGVDAADTRVRVKPQKKVMIHQSNSCCDTDCQTCGVEAVQADLKTYDKQLETLPRRLIAKLKAKKNTRFVYSQLLNFLRCKHFMHVRDTHFITTLVADARAWLLKNNYTMENALDYAILATAVQQAFIVSAEELELRATLKNPKIRDHIDHHNATMSGDLGRVNMFSYQSGKHALAKAARRPFTRSVHLAAPKLDLV